MKAILLATAAAVLFVSCEKKTEVSLTPNDSVVVSTPTSSSLWWKGNWNTAKGQLKQNYASLTDDDLLYAEGKEEELYGRLQKKLGKTRAEVEDMLNGLK